MIEKGEQRYFPCNRFKYKEEIIHVGLDLDKYHNEYEFHEILAKMRLIYEASNGKADLLQVYAQLDGKIGIVSEDMSSGGKNQVWKHNFLGELDESLLLVFDEKDEEELCRSTFSVRDKNYNFRYPIVDLNHLHEIRPEWQDKYKAYVKQYKNDERFRIHEIK